MRKRGSKRHLQRAAGYAVGAYEVAAHAVVLFIEFFLFWLGWGVTVLASSFVRFVFTPVFSYVLRRELFNVLGVGVIIALWVVMAADTVVVPDKAETFIKQDDLSCMTELISRESNFRDPPYVRASVGEIARQRKMDGSRAGFADSICGVVWQQGQFTGMFLNRWTIPAWLWADSERIARDVLAGKYAVLLTGSLSCARYYKRTDDVGTTSAGRAFFEKLTRQSEIGPHTFYCDPKGGVQAKKPAAKPLSTTPEKKTVPPSASTGTLRPPSMKLVRQSAEYQKFLARANEK